MRDGIRELLQNSDEQALSNFSEKKWRLYLISMKQTAYYKQQLEKSLLKM